MPKTKTQSSGAVPYMTELLQNLTERGRALLGYSRGDLDKMDLVTLGKLLLSRRGEASGVVLARALLKGYVGATQEERLTFLVALAEQFGPDEASLERAIEAFRRDGTPESMGALHRASEPQRQELIRRLNLAPGGTSAIVRMREDVLENKRSYPALDAVDSDFIHLFSSWFNRGFLSLRPIDWTTPANILEKIIRYEAVHAIADWNDLRNRLEPSDRRCFAFFHPQLADEPLIFVEVALTREIPDAIQPLLEQARAPIAAGDATTAVFYSISNTQAGLGGVSFGNFLIKQVVDDLKRDLPDLKTFVTLSPVPTFARWLDKERKAETGSALSAADRAGLAALDNADWHKSAETRNELRPVLSHAAATYFLRAKDRKGRPVDPVARFHLGNGARLERLNLYGDLSPKGLRESYGLMVNYLYALDDIEKNHEAFAERAEVVSASSVRRALRSDAIVQDA